MIWIPWPVDLAGTKWMLRINGWPTLVGVVFDMWWMTNLFHLAYLVTRLGVAPLLRESLSHPVMN